MEGFKLLKAGMSVLQALTQPIEHLFPYPAVSKESGDATERDSQVDEVMKMAVEGLHASDRSAGDHLGGLRRLMARLNRHKAYFCVCETSQRSQYHHISRVIS